MKEQNSRLAARVLPLCIYNYVAQQLVACDGEETLLEVTLRFGECHLPIPWRIIKDRVLIAGGTVVDATGLQGRVETRRYSVALGVGTGELTVRSHATAIDLIPVRNGQPVRVPGHNVLEGRTIVHDTNGHIDNLFVAVHTEQTVLVLAAGPQRYRTMITTPVMIKICAIINMTANSSGAQTTTTTTTATATTTPIRHHR